MPKSASGAGPEEYEGKEWCRKAREECIARKAQCGRDCPHALESMDWSCMVKSTTQVRKALNGIPLEPTPIRIVSYAVKLDPDKVRAILDDLHSGMSNQRVAEKWGMGKSTISGIRSGNLWKEVYAEWHAAKESA